MKKDQQLLQIIVDTVIVIIIIIAIIFTNHKMVWGRIGCETFFFSESNRSMIARHK